MNQIISLGLVALGLIFLLTPTFLVNKDNTNNFSSFIHEYHQFIGLGLLFLGFYLYSEYTNDHHLLSTDSVSTISSENTHMSSSQQNASY
jgi:hypothetical protein